MIPQNLFILDNGLRVVHSCDPQSAMCVLNMLYDTGARDECPEHTGMAHLFEHLMFGGSVNAPSFDGALELAGGNNNAATSNDFTVFYDEVPCQNVETAFFLESDRMMALAFSDKALEVQRAVVIEEFKEVCLNRPYGRLMHVLRSLLYDKHPYRWPVIGLEPEHVARTTQADVKRWFYNHYAPNNAVLSVVGNISLERCRQLAQQWFGGIPARQIPARQLVDDPWPGAGEVREEVVDDPSVPQTVIAIGFRMDPYGTPGYFAADAITDILSAGKSSRLNQRLLMGTDLFTGVEASISGSEHSGFVLLFAQLAKGDDESVAIAKEMMLAEARQLAQPGNVSAYELERTKNRYESTFAFDNVNLVSRAQNLAMAVYHGEDINDNVARYRSLTLDDITTTARRLFVEHAPAVVIYR